ncbi:MAG: 50S ribosomal protein L14e [Promethearchaeia archaeon]|nr:MAG: 50S ribosomal protein L14e [Candidatus Lokiarchaeia archaeon]
MAVFDVGRVAVKTLGREAGYYCTVVEVIDHSFVLVEGLKVRRRRCNVRHLAPTPEKLDIQKGASLDDIKKELKAKNLEEKFQTRIKLDL